MSVVDCTEARAVMTSSLASSFRTLRHVLGLSVEEISRLGGVAPDYWRRLEDGTADPSAAWVRAAAERIAAHLNP